MFDIRDGCKCFDVELNVTRCFPFSYLNLFGMVIYRHSCPNSDGATHS